jgi:hypothetical protein
MATRISKDAEAWLMEQLESAGGVSSSELVKVRSDIADLRKTIESLGVRVDRARKVYDRVIALLEG